MNVTSLLSKSSIPSIFFGLPFATINPCSLIYPLTNTACPFNPYFNKYGMLYVPVYGSSKWTPAISASPLFIAIIPPVEPTFITLATIPLLCKISTKTSTPMQWLPIIIRSATFISPNNLTSTSSFSSKINLFSGISTNPSASANVEIAPE